MTSRNCEAPFFAMWFSPEHLFSCHLCPCTQPFSWVYLYSQNYLRQLSSRSGSGRELTDSWVLQMWQQHWKSLCLISRTDLCLKSWLWLHRQHKGPRVQELGFLASQLLSDYVSVGKPLSEAICQLLIGANHDTRETHSLRTLSWPKLYSVHSTECN